MPLLFAPAPVQTDLSLMMQAGAKVHNVKDFYPTAQRHRANDNSAIQKAVDAALKEQKGVVYLPYLGREYELFTPIHIDSSRVNIPNGTRLMVLGEGPLGTIRYKGVAGTSAFRIAGPHRSEFQNLSVRLDTSNTTAFEISHLAGTSGGSARPHFRNAYDNRFTRCRATMSANTKNCVGFSAATDEIPARGGDLSANVFDQCEVRWEHRYNGDVKTAAFLEEVHKAGHIGFNVLGSNSLANEWRSCAAMFMDIAASLRNDAKTPQSRQAGGTNSFRDFHCGFNALIFAVPGGNEFSVIGGRTEHSGALLLVGPNSPSSGGENGLVTIRDYTFDDGSPERNDQIGYVDKDAFIQLNFTGNASIDGCSFNAIMHRRAETKFISARDNAGSSGPRYISINATRKTYGADWTRMATWRSWLGGAASRWRIKVDAETPR